MDWRGHAPKRNALGISYQASLMIANIGDEKINHRQSAKKVSYLQSAKHANKPPNGIDLAFHNETFDVSFQLRKIPFGGQLVRVFQIREFHFPP